MSVPVVSAGLGCNLCCVLKLMLMDDVLGLRELVPELGGEGAAALGDRAGSGDGDRPCLEQRVVLSCLVSHVSPKLFKVSEKRHASE